MDSTLISVFLIGAFIGFFLGVLFYHQLVVGGK